MKTLQTATLLALMGVASLACAQDKPAISLDEFMNATDIRDARIAPDGRAAVIALSSPDWQKNRFKEDLWLWTAGGGRAGGSRSAGAMTALTHSGHDSSPVWSPDGRMIAFLSDRPLPGGGEGSEGGKDETSRVWLISANGGEAFPLYREARDVHAFAWSGDGTQLFFSIKEPLSKDAVEAQRADWKDVIRWREQERGDVLLALGVAQAVEASAKTPEAHGEASGMGEEGKAADGKPVYPAGARVVAHSGFAIDSIVPSPGAGAAHLGGGERIAFTTRPVSHRLEDPAATEIFLVGSQGGEVRQLTHNEGLESHVVWAPSGGRILFLVGAAAGSVEGPYQDEQGRLYALEVESGKITRLGAEFRGSWEDLAVAAGGKAGGDGQIFAVGLSGTHSAIYRVAGARAESAATLPGSYGHLDASAVGGAVLFTHSTIHDAAQVYVAENPAALNEAKAATALNPVFAERAQVSWRPYRWTSKDGTPVEGVLIFPPGKQDAKKLRMLTLIHGGPADADGDSFGADWYNWATLAAARGWLVFRPNYRGSAGYGDAFLQAIRPHLVSLPGEDILSGVDALVRDGLADPDHLAIGGYSYGGYMTNWIITETTRFRSAVTGAGAVEHAANWGFDDLTRDDAWYLSGAPWEKPELYQSEGALFRLDKVKTPTHIVGGNEDNRVSYFEQIVFDRGLETLHVPHTLLLFPGENHPLANNPWHGYIKVREELKWMERYDAK